jgi:hypothetical protein
MGPENTVDPLDDPAIVAEMAQAWQESLSDDPVERHEEGGFVVLNSEGLYAVERWPRGGQSRILPLPLDAHNCYNGRVVVAAFHTHPNPPIDEIGQNWEQGPSQSDRRWHGRRRLRGFVISRELVYEIDVKANILVIGNRNEVLSL